MEELRKAQVTQAVECAQRAPSLHNSQPWRFEQEGPEVRVRADRSRWLRDTDPLGRELLLGCGGAVRHLVLGLRAQGLDVSWQLLPDPDRDPDLLAIVRILGHRPTTLIETELHRASQHRHTERAAFADEPVNLAVLDRLRRLAEHEGCTLDVVAEDAVLSLATLTDRADQILAEDPLVQAELGRWTSHGDSPREGMPSDALPGAGHRGSPVTLRTFGPVAPEPRRSSPPAPEHPTMLVLSTSEDSPRSWLACGWTLTDLLLTLTTEGLAASPMTQALEIAWTRSRLRDELELTGHPQMVLRVGYPTGAPSRKTSRRRASEVLR